MDLSAEAFARVTGSGRTGFFARWDWRGAIRALMAAVAIAFAAPGAAAAQQTYLLVVAGLSGEPAFATRFHEWGSTLVRAAEERHSVPASNIYYFAERPERDPELIDGPARRENIEAAIREIAERAGPGDAVFIVLIGHGSYDGRESMFNLTGADMSAEDWAAQLDLLAEQRVAFVNAASASGDFIRVLSKPGRAIATATRDGRQNNATIFPQYFVTAFSEDVADSDRDGRISLLEAYEYARREVARDFQSTGRLQTEHASLDDNGDGTGTHEPDPQSGDGAFARGIYLGGTGRVAAEDASPELQALFGERQRLENELNTLRASRATMQPDAYDAELERLLIELARVSQSIRELEEAAP